MKNNKGKLERVGNIVLAWLFIAVLALGVYGILFTAYTLAVHLWGMFGLWMANELIVSPRAYALVIMMIVAMMIAIYLEQNGYLD